MVAGEGKKSEILGGPAEGSPGKSKPATATTTPNPEQVRPRRAGPLSQGLGFRSLGGQQHTQHKQQHTTQTTTQTTTKKHKTTTQNNNTTTTTTQQQEHKQHTTQQHHHHNNNNNNRKFGQHSKTLKLAKVGHDPEVWREGVSGGRSPLPLCGVNFQGESRTSQERGFFPRRAGSTNKLQKLSASIRFHLRSHIRPTENVLPEF